MPRKTLSNTRNIYLNIFNWLTPLRVMFTNKKNCIYILPPGCKSRLPLPEYLCYLSNNNNKNNYSSSHL